MVPNSLIGFSTAITAMVIVDVLPVEALPVTYDFTVVVTQGSLAGNTFTGSFTYDDALVEGVGTETVGVQDGLRVKMNFLQQDYTETEDVDYPQYPQLILKEGKVQSLDFWIEPGQRVMWWGLPGWEIQLSPRTATPIPVTPN